LVDRAFFEAELLVFFEAERDEVALFRDTVDFLAEPAVRAAFFAGAFLAGDFFAGAFLFAPGRFAVAGGEVPPAMPPRTAPTAAPAGPSSEPAAAPAAAPPAAPRGLISSEGLPSVPVVVSFSAMPVSFSWGVSGVVGWEETSAGVIPRRGPESL
jgi:hypothetical protein